MAFAVKLVPPHLDKGVSLQVFGDLDDEIVRKFRSLLRVPVFREVNAFLQGDQPDWKMIELWTRDEEEIERCHKLAEEVLGVKIPKGDFSPEEINALLRPGKA